MRQSMQKPMKKEMPHMLLYVVYETLTAGILPQYKFTLVVDKTFCDTPNQLKRSGVQH